MSLKIEILEAGVRKLSRDRIYGQLLSERMSPEDKEKMQTQRLDFEEKYIDLKERLRIHSLIEDLVVKSCKRYIEDEDLTALSLCVKDHLKEVKEKVERR